MDESGWTSPSLVCLECPHRPLGEGKQGAIRDKGGGLKTHGCRLPQGQHPRYRALRTLSANPSSFCLSPETHRQPNAHTAHGLITVLHFAGKRMSPRRPWERQAPVPKRRAAKPQTLVHPAYASNCLLIGEQPVICFSKYSSSPMTSVTSHESKAWPQAILPDPLRERGPPC